MLKNIVIFSLLLIIGYLVGKDKILSMVDKVCRAKLAIPKRKELTENIGNDIVD